MDGTTYASLTDWYRHGTPARHAEAVRAPPGSPVALIRAAKPAGQWRDPPATEFGLRLCVGGTAPRARWDLGTGRRHAGRFAPGVFSLAPPGAATDCALDGGFVVLVVALGAAWAAERAAGVRPGFSGDFGPMHGPLFTDPFVAALCERMWAESEGAGPPARLFLDGAALALVAALLRLSEGRNAAPNTAEVGTRQAGLAPWRLRHALDLIGDRLDDDLSLDELATAAGLSPVYFARQFRRSTGLPPHRYLLRQRVRRAEELLAGTSLPLAEVALRCGFCDQAHLTRAFRAHAGTTPAAFRRAVHGD